MNPQVPPLKMILLCLACLALVAYVDCITGQELIASCAYLVPVLIAAWSFRRGWMVAVCVASGVTAFVVDELDGYMYSHPAIGYWNAFTCFAISIIAGFALSRLKETLREKQQTNVELRSALENLEASTSEIRKLQGGLQTVCAWTNRIKVGERWMKPDEFLSSCLNLKLSHGISPEAYEEVSRELGIA